MTVRKLIAAATFLVMATTAFAQSANYDVYPFINSDIDTISYDSTALKSFFVKMKELKEGKRKNVVIVQLGDSHIQADFFSGWVRQHLQQRYGNGGRGLVFPYNVAKTNEPTNFKSKGTGEWKGRRCVMVSPSEIPIGVSGFGLRTTDSASTLSLQVKNGDNLDYSFNKMTFFHDKGPTTYNWVVYTRADFKDSVLVKDSGKMAGIATDSVMFKDTVREFTMCTEQSDSTQNEALLFGMVLTNDKPGIIYHTIGANGARYHDYNVSEYFYQQLGQLKPDLIIISLGTNEAFARNFSEYVFRDDIDTMFANIKKVAPQTDLLLTAPNDAMRGHRYKNKDIIDAVNTLKRVAMEHHAAFWDFYHIMGGYGSMPKWYMKHLCQKDRLHFTVPGYTLQAELFYDALNKAIKDGLDKLAP